jgi:hypothetical protein
MALSFSAKRPSPDLEPAAAPQVRLGMGSLARQARPGPSREDAQV